MKTKLIFLFLSVVLSVSAQSPLSALLPMPNHVTTPEKDVPFRVTEKTAIYYDAPQLEFAALQIRLALKELMGVDVPFSSSPKSSIRLGLDASVTGKEHYLLEVRQKGISLKASDAAGAFYGTMTFRQLLLGDVCRTLQKEVSAIRVDDAPRFAYRALMLDPARHFLPVKDVKSFIDHMARYKYNVLQLHLTDDQGWRIEIKKYPLLTQIGSQRNPKTSSSNGPDNGYYTQEQLKDLIQYAALRNVEIVPELDIPGHTVAVLAAYPELGCTHTDSLPKVIGKTFDLMLCAGREKVYDMYRDILQEVAALFPSPRIHLGGDEAVLEKNWSRCERCQALMKRFNYTQTSQLMNYFFGKMFAFVRENGKKPILWCELNKIYPPADAYLFDYPQDVTLVTWRYGLTPDCLRITALHGNPLIMAPGEYAYLDYPQFKGDLPEVTSWEIPITTLEKCYQLDPGYGLPAEKQSHILGVMGTLWGEAIKDINRVNYMAYPRGLALAEAGWTRMEHRSWQSFKQRMYPNLLDLMKSGVSFRVPFETSEFFY